MSQLARTSVLALQRLLPIGTVRSTVDWSAGDRWRLLPGVALASATPKAERLLAAMTLALTDACQGSIVVAPCAACRAPPLPVTTVAAILRNMLAASSTRE